MVDFSIHSVLAELAQCMRSFSNLHTVRLRMSVSSLTDMVARGAFKTHTYPSVRTVILSCTAYPLLLSCPNIQTIASPQTPEKHYALWILRCLQKSPLVEDVRCFFHPYMLCGMSPLLLGAYRVLIVIDVGSFLPSIRLLRLLLEPRDSRVSYLSVWANLSPTAVS